MSTPDALTRDDDPLVDWLAGHCPDGDAAAVVLATADWLARQERDPWLSPAYRIAARLLRDQINNNEGESL